MDIIKQIKTGAILKNHKFATILWFGLSIIAVVLEILKGREIHNYQIFKEVFIHLKAQQNLYIPFNWNLYGPVFGIIMAPFALLPDNVGVFFWVLANAAFLYYAINKLPIALEKRAFILIVASLEMMNVASWVEPNAAVAACLILSYCCIAKEKEWQAAFFIAIATFVKLYGITGLAFFFFSKHRIKFIGWMLIWGIILFVAPMLLSSPSFILQTYVDWKDTLLQKNSNNLTDNNFLNISLLGVVISVLKIKTSQTILLALGALLFLSQYMHYKFFSNKVYQLYILCSILIFTVIFSSSAESPTYIISFTGVCLWYVLQPRSKVAIIAITLAFIFTSLSHSDLLTSSFRTYVARPYKVKAFASIIIWFVILFQIWRKQFLSAPDPEADFELSKPS